MKPSLLLRASTSSDSSTAEILALLQSMQGQIATISSQGVAINSKQSVVLGKIDEVKHSLDSRIDSLDAKFLNLEVENNKLKELLCALGVHLGCASMPAGLAPARRLSRRSLLRKLPKPHRPFHVLPLPPPRLARLASALPPRSRT